MFKNNQPTPKNLFERLEAEKAQYQKWDRDQEKVTDSSLTAQNKYQKSRSRKDFSLLILAGAVVFLIVVSFFASTFKSPKKTDVDRSSLGKTKISVNNVTVYVSIAKTPSQWQLGLSGRKSMKANEGMLFVAEKKTVPTFWMKDMLFPLDIIWIVDGQIIQIDQKVPNPKKDQPDIDLVFYKPYVPVEYVLEVNAGFVEKHAIAVRDLVDLSEVK